MQTIYANLLQNLEEKVEIGSFRLKRQGRANKDQALPMGAWLFMLIRARSS